MKYLSTYLIFSIVLLTNTLTSQSDVRTRYEFKYDENKLVTGVRIWFVLPLQKDTIYHFIPSRTLSKAIIHSIKETRVVSDELIDYLSPSVSLILYHGDTISAYKRFNGCLGKLPKSFDIKGGTDDSLSIYQDIDNFKQLVNRYYPNLNYNDNIHQAKIFVKFVYPHYYYNWTENSFKIKIP